MPSTARGGSPLQWSVHVPAVRQSRLQLEAQLTSQLAPSAQVTLLLAPTVRLQLAASQVTFELSPVAITQSLPGAHRTLHDEPQA